MQITEEVKTLSTFEELILIATITFCKKSNQRVLHWLVKKKTLGGMLYRKLNQSQSKVMRSRFTVAKLWLIIFL